jgi:adenylylsulfate kinase
MKLLGKNNSNVDNHSNTFFTRSLVVRGDREKLNAHKSMVLWFTGLSGSGKSTLAHAVEKELHRMGCRTLVFDGDNVRQGLCRDLGFSDADRAENIRRIAEVIRLFVEAGVIALTAFISPLRAHRRQVRAMLGEDLVEIYCRCPLEVCAARDVKGLYQRASQGEIANFTGISSPYEEPEHPDLILDTHLCSLEDCRQKVLALVKDRIMPEPAAMALNYGTNVEPERVNQLRPWLGVD